MKCTKKMKQTKQMKSTKQTRSTKRKRPTNEMGPNKRMKSTEPVTVIDDLPLEMIRELFEYLPPKDLATCSMVNKRWHSVYATFRLHTLVVTDCLIDLYDLCKWLDSNWRMEEEDRCCPAMFLRWANKPLLSNLKHLTVSGPSPKFDLNELNRFSQLVHLQIHIPYLDGVRVNWNLPRLKVLVFHHYNKDCALSIDCPLLSTLVYAGEPDEANLLKVKQPATIRNLYTNMIDPEWLALFKNVECLVTRKFEAISKASLLSMPRLKELRYNQDIKHVFEKESRLGDGTINRMKRTLSEFVDEAKELRGDDFQFTFAGFELTNVDIDEIDFGVKVDRFGEETISNDYVYMKNYRLIEPGALPFVKSVNYTRLLHHVKRAIPLCLSQKFTCINWVEATAEVRDADKFLNFLKSLRFLRRLGLGKTRLGQEFYDQLPTSARSLGNLYLSEGYCENGLQLNFDFAGQFSRLSHLTVYPGLFRESLLSLLRSSGRLEMCCSYVRSKGHVRVVKDSTKWKIFNLRKERQFESPEEIVNFFEGSRINQTSGEFEFLSF